jgi:hypothetical protein
MATFEVPTYIFERFRRMVFNIAEDAPVITDRLGAIHLLLQIKLDEIEQGREPAIGTPAHEDRKRDLGIRTDLL